MGLLERFISSQKKLCTALEKRLPSRYQQDGQKTFERVVIPEYLKPGIKVYDIGGGKSPIISRSQKESFNLHVVGLDIDHSELDQAPEKIYDSTIVANIETFSGTRDGDLIICNALLEHVPQVDQAFSSLASLAKDGGTLLLFTPSRNALFARLNSVLPEKLKEILLFSMYPQSRAKQGFPAFYHRCTPRDFRELAEQNQLEVEKFLPFYRSEYFTFFFPLHLLWRVWLLTFHLFCGDQAAETFVFVLKKHSKTGS